MVGVTPEGYSIVATCVAFLFVDTVAVIFRLLARWSTKGRFFADDAWIILGLIFWYAWAALVVGGVEGIAGGFEVEKWTAPPDQLTILLKMLYSSRIILCAGYTSIKLSILIYYRLLFPTAKFRKAVNWVCGICVAWWLALTVACVFQCVPINDAWDPSTFLHPELRTCDRFGFLMFMLELTNVLIDVVILAMPIYMVAPLPWKQRILVSLIFLLGGFVCITGIVRMSYLLDKNHIERVYNMPGASLWGVIEFGCAIACACLPTFAPLRHVLMRSPRVQRWTTSLRGSMHSVGSTRLPLSKHSLRWSIQPLAHPTRSQQVASPSPEMAKSSPPSPSGPGVPSSVHSSDSIKFALTQPPQIRVVPEGSESPKPGGLGWS